MGADLQPLGDKTRNGRSALPTAATLVLATVVGTAIGALGWLAPVQAALGPLVSPNRDAEHAALPSFLSLPLLPGIDAPADTSVRVRIDLQLDARDQAVVQEASAAIVRGVSAFLVGLEPVDLEGGRRLDWLKDQIRLRLRMMAGPAALVQDVLIAEVDIR